MPIKPTDQQKKAVEAVLGAVLVVAGPGAGKTFCLINRIGYLIDRVGFKPERVLAVTFTNKAAEEVADRLEELLGARGTGVHGGTIHALCATILREFAEAAGLQPGFGIADDDYQRTLLRQMRQGQRTPDLLKSFGRHRLMGFPLSPGDAEVFREYTRTLRRRNIVDFDDLVVLTGELLRKDSAVADAVAARWDYVLVDEFQDVNAAQYEILRRIAEPHGNIMAVGDDEQSIFSWAGADPAVLKRFERDYGLAAPVVLETNHRTSQQIFGVARRLLRGNEPLFKKDLRATQQSEFEVRVIGFPDDDAEAVWIIGDIAADHEAHGEDWGEYAVLYRRHELGNRLEAAFLKAGVPCRLAKGRPLSEDRVIGQVIAALRLVKDPRDSSAAEEFAKFVLPPHLMQRVEAEAMTGDGEFLLAVRDLAGSMARDPDSKKLWRLVYAVENLASMRKKHATLAGLIEELLATRSGPFKNVLEDRHEDLTDPSDVPAAVLLAQRLAAARDRKSRVVIEPMNGLEVALRGLLFGAGFKLALYDSEVMQAELDDLRIGYADAGPEGLAFTAFKALQLLQTSELGGALGRYVTFDLETTGKDTRSCEIVEIAAVRAEGGTVVGEFHSLVKPRIPIEPGAQKQHGYSDADVADAPSFAEVWPKFLAFAGVDPLIAHNGLKFDVPVLRRMAGGLGWNGHLQAYDTLPIAQSLGGGSAKLTALAERFGIPVGRAHHALDDTRMLVGVYEALEVRRLARARKASLVNLLPYLGLAFALDGRRHDTDEVKLLYEEYAARKALGRFSDCLEYYEAERNRLGIRGPSLDEVIRALGGRGLMDKLREERDAASRYPEAVARLETLIEQAPDETLDQAMQRFLDRVALSAARGPEVESHRVNLLTLHSTKGLEFSRVYIVGVEDEQLPGWVAKDEDEEFCRQEARRLLYVGMTRARERLVLTRVERRNGKPSGGSRFLDEMELLAETREAISLVP